MAMLAAPNQGILVATVFMGFGACAEEAIGDPAWNHFPFSGEPPQFILSTLGGSYSFSKCVREYKSDGGKLLHTLVNISTGSFKACGTGGGLQRSPRFSARRRDLYRALRFLR
ncbi:6241_t:CDS:2 [Acaulospora colombiana]|uniref:6241_t:CDS:1 n=1 Tax=Acaulospora colombiana TaxID=27376 RepID=A0ACA9KG97_9GLOM|nr:6241_t:CDS:2 [Acaulospora colombiana]